MRGKSPLIKLRDSMRNEGVLPSGRVASPSPQKIAQQNLPLPPLCIPLGRGPFQNNGATPWYAQLQLGTPGQSLKIALDTGSNFIWTTSTYCHPTSCIHAGNGRFNPADSSSFQRSGSSPKVVDFGPWGEMHVKAGFDDVCLKPSNAPFLEFYLSEEYKGTQFAQLDWDGGLGIPSGSDYADPDCSLLPAQLMDVGLTNPDLPYISFATDPVTKKGYVTFGAPNPSEFDPHSGIFLPWTPYTAFPQVKYIWSTPLARYSIGTYQVTNVQFCLDSGSSQFKGDDSIMASTLAQIKQLPEALLRMQIGTTAEGNQGEIVIPPEVYNVKIEAGPQREKILPQFNPLGLTDLVLVGSVLMDHLYTVYVYEVVVSDAGHILSPVGMYVFNKKDGLPVIRSSSAQVFTFAPRIVANL